ncbi:hypothetical protein KIH75_01885 [Bifidobacterium sp. 64T4]|uniref:hypothetical protein n=1 Tax=Bifidobacterium pongonis TaxID=2834432 RepID=UPI001C59B810|nr:hypothetical protein [Bifidobacterium pongonis]MBW3094117.1 hypothetical protein [Bifidobacterium pongonis]
MNRGVKGVKGIGGSRHVERIRIDTTGETGRITLLADIEFDDNADLRFHGDVIAFFRLDHPVRGAVCGMWHRLREGNIHSIDLDVVLPFGPSRLTLDAFEKADGRYTGQWTTPSGTPHPVEANVIFDSTSDDADSAVQ